MYQSHAVEPDLDLVGSLGEESKTGQIGSEVVACKNMAGSPHQPMM